MEMTTKNKIFVHEPAKLPEWLYKLVVNDQHEDNAPAKINTGNPPIVPHPYVQTAINGEIANILSAAEGNRNDTLNTAAFCLGQLIGGGLVAEDVVSKQLLAAANMVGLGTKESIKTIESGIKAGKKKPRGIPNPDQKTAVDAVDVDQVEQDAEQDADDDSITFCYSSKKDAQDAQDAKQPKMSESQSKKGKNVATELVKLVSDVKLFHDSEEIGYGEFKIGDHTERFKIRSKSFKYMLTRRHYTKTKKAVSSQALSDAINLLDSKAIFEGEKHDVHIRVAISNEVVFIDLCDSEWQVAMVTSNGVTIIHDSSIKFVRHRGMLSLPKPENGNLEDFWKFFNVNGNDRILLITFMVAALRPGYPFPILILQGEQGSAKSTLAKMIRMLIDPSVAPLRTTPKNELDLLLMARNAWLVVLDNISGISVPLSDSLCRLSTGGGFSTRELYSDTNETIIDVKRPVILNGITDIASKEDLIDRSIILQSQPIPEEKRRPEDELMKEFETARPGLFGVLLNILSSVLKNLPNTHMVRLPRMADFAKLGTAAEEAMGCKPGEFLEIYSGNQKDSVQSGLDGSLLYLEINEWLANLDKWTGTASKLLDVLNKIVDEQIIKQRSWPKTAKLLSGQLRMLAPAMRSVGIDVTFSKKDGKRIVTIAKVKNFASSASSASNGDNKSTDNQCINQMTPETHMDAKVVLQDAEIFHESMTPFDKNL
ncbi:MAG: hypothetical protein HQL07_03065 [Nitrospirae bacterium]|nr:hypothetical protein [Magnetococcales bacterium]HAT50434.1 hypothetical protein [Alphaproteobacteria bacterium]